MYKSFFEFGSVLSVVLMTYTACVMFEVARHYKYTRAEALLYSPPLIHHPLAVFLMFGSVPCAIWPAIYIGTFSGWIGGVIAWGVLQLIESIAARLLAVNGPFLGFHFIFATISYPIGYYLSITTPAR